MYLKQSWRLLYIRPGPPRGFDVVSQASYLCLPPNLFKEALMIKRWRRAALMRDTHKRIYKTLAKVCLIIIKLDLIQPVSSQANKFNSCPNIDYCLLLSSPYNAQTRLGTKEFMMKSIAIRSNSFHCIVLTQDAVPRKNYPRAVRISPIINPFR